MSYDKTILRILPVIIVLNLMIFSAYVTYKVSIGIEAFMYLLPALLVLDFLLILAFGFLSFKDIKKQFNNINRNAWILLTLVMLLGLGLRMVLVPQTHRIYFDEDIYEDIGNSIATEGRTILCNYGTPEKCEEGILNKEPTGYPVLLAIVYFIFGTSETVTFALSMVVAVLSIFLVFLLTYLLFENERVALYASLLFALFPSHMVWSASVGVELYSIFFILLTLVLFMVYLKTENLRILMFSVTLLVFAVQVRHENGLFIPLFGVMFLLFGKNQLRNLANYKFWIPWLVLLLLLAPHLSHMLYANKTDTWGAPEGKRFGLEYAERQFTENAGFFYDNSKHPWIFAAFALIGIIYSFKDRKKALASLLLWFVPFFILFLFFYAGGVNSGGIGHRFSLNYATPILILGGYGLFVVESLLKKFVRYEAFVVLILVATCLVSLYPLEGFITVPDHQAFRARENHDFAYLMRDKIDDSCYILSHNPSMYLVMGKNSLQTWYGQNNEVMKRIFNKTDCVIFEDGFWCLYEPYRNSVCKNMHDKYQLTEIARWNIRGYTFERGMNESFAFYRVANPFL